jgi:hypothetical protein
LAQKQPSFKECVTAHLNSPASAGWKYSAKNDRS